MNTTTTETCADSSLGEKQRINHENLHDRYNLALKNEFYLECIMLVYNLMEDRLCSFLHYAGVFDKDAEKMSVHRASRASVRLALDLEDGKQYNLRSINNKIRLVRCLMTLPPEPETKLLQEIAARVEKRLDPQDVLKTLDACTAWKDKRNTYVHGYLKVYERPDPEVMKAYVTEGMAIARRIDYYVRRFAPSKGAKGIREKFKLPTTKRSSRKK